MQRDGASGEVGDRDRGDDRLEGDVLETFEFQVHLNLALRRNREQKKQGASRWSNQWRVKYRNSQEMKAAAPRELLFLLVLE
jgi:hypothetical protein